MFICFVKRLEGISGNSYFSQKHYEDVYGLQEPKKRFVLTKNYCWFKGLFGLRLCKSPEWHTVQTTLYVSL